MFSDKNSILQLASLMLKFGIRHVVLSPGSRNAPLIYTFTQHPDFSCYSVVDERSAGFFALGLSQKLQQPVAVCCTSGTALLNYGPAIAEAYYQQIPLLVISADRPAAWIGQADGQTIPQNNAFASITKRSVQLPEPANETDQWHCNRMINEALIALTSGTPAPVHINVPLSEPLYHFAEAMLPDARFVQHHIVKPIIDIEYFKTIWHTSSKRMIVVGQLPPSNGLDAPLSQLVQTNDVVILSEHIGNIHLPELIGNFDLMLASASDEELSNFVPDLLITVGGHITSKRLKQFLRKRQPSHHWNLCPDGSLKDTFQSMTDLIPTSALDFLMQLSPHLNKDPNVDKPFYNTWKKQSETISEKTANYLRESPFCDLSAICLFLNALPPNTALHLSNSAPIRYAQFCNINATIAIYSNRGTNGIDGVISTAVGFSASNSGMTFLLVGDLSFFYDINGLWNKYINKKLRILLINNGGGNMFHLINGANHSETMENYIACHHADTAKDRAIAFGLHYMSATNYDELNRCLPYFCNPEEDYPIVLEIFTNKEINTLVYNILQNGD